MRDPQDVDVLETEPGVRWVERMPLAVAVAALIVAMDQATKWLALQTLEAGSCSRTDACIDLFAGAKLRLVYNHGAAFSSGTGYGPIFGVLAFFMTFLLLYLASTQLRLRSLVAFAAIAGGAFGNLLDRFFRAEDGFLSGAVIDFVDVGWWPVFNFADSAIVVGVAAVILFTVIDPAPEDDPAGGPDAGNDPDAEAIGGDTTSDHDGWPGRAGISDHEPAGEGFDQDAAGDASERAEDRAVKDPTSVGSASDGD